MAQRAKDTTSRFSDKVGDYTKYRPSYPTVLVDFICQRFSITPLSLVADIGSGTGIFTKLLLQNGLRVIAVEPNQAMRDESDRQLAQFENYQSLNGTAEQSQLGSASVDLITVAQAFHWFDLSLTMDEFARILKPEGGIALVWNRRDSTQSEFLREYERMLQAMIPEYNKVKHTNLADQEILQFLGEGSKIYNYETKQRFDFKGLRGRLLSSSYCPKPHQDSFEPLMDRLQTLFDHYAVGDQVLVPYKTQLYVSQRSQRN